VTVSIDTPPDERTQRLWKALFVLVVAVHLAVLYWPRSPSSGGLPVDKVVHAVVFGIVLWVAAQAGLRIWLVAALLAVHAVVSELIQHYLLTGRSGDPADSVADLAGVVIVTLFLWRRK
jgi:VanZ family protein